MSQTQAKKEIKGEMMAEGKKFMEVDELFDQEKFQETLEHLRYFEVLKKNYLVNFL